MHRNLQLGGDTKALVILAASGRDSDLAPFLSGARLGRSLLVLPVGGEPHLGYWSPMERDEAASAGLRLLDPQQLEISRANRENAADSEALAWVIERALLLAGVSPGGVALAGSMENGRVVAATAKLAADGWQWRDGHDAVLRMRKRKLDEEIADIRRSAVATVAAFRLVARMLDEAMIEASGELTLAGSPLTVSRVKGEIAASFGRAGVEQPEGGIVAPGAEGAVPHTSGTPERRLCASESLVVDLFPRSRLFADCTRTFCVGDPPEALRSAHAEVEAVLQWARDHTKVEVTGYDLQRGVCERLAAAGYPTPISDPGTQVGYVHGLGHGVGYDLHELPSFGSRPGPDGVLEVGDVITLEPGLYDEQRGYGVRIEDLAVVREDGLEILTPLPTVLEPGGYLD